MSDVARTAPLTTSSAMRSKMCCFSFAFAAGGVSGAVRAFSISFKIWSR